MTASTKGGPTLANVIYRVSYKIAVNVQISNGVIRTFNKVVLPPLH
ncbi:hypothetical protein [Seonamhaeicola sp. ML3]|nr:hypothetical protein [Seonamhaeicola sp. ML3]